jgi:hypothetical protein
VYPGCLSRIRIFPSRIPDPESERFRIRIKEFKYLISLKKDLGCSSRILDPYPDFFPTPDPGVNHLLPVMLAHKGLGGWSESQDSKKACLLYPSCFMVCSSTVCLVCCVILFPAFRPDIYLCGNPGRDRSSSLRGSRPVGLVAGRAPAPFRRSVNNTVCTRFS